MNCEMTDRIVAHCQQIDGLTSAIYDEQVQCEEWLNWLDDKGESGLKELPDQLQKLRAVLASIEANTRTIKELIE